MDNYTISFVNKVIHLISDFSDVVQNLWWVVLLIAAIIFSLTQIVFFTKKTNNFTRLQIKNLIKTEKYIPDLFVELNETKEIIRYFIYSNRWKKRLIKDFNFVYNNFYGDILRKACNKPNACFHLKNKTSLKEIEDTVKGAIDLHYGFRDRKIELIPDYKQSQYLFEYIYFPYIETLEGLIHYSKAANGRYIVLTGSAGNGKTNLLCSISELLIKLKEPVVFFNAKDIEGDILEYVFNKLKIPPIYKNHKRIYLRLINCILTIRRKYFFIIIDAVNENDDVAFRDMISEFCNKILLYSHIKIIVACRNEYYKERFRKYLVENIKESAYELDLKEQNYTSVAIKHIMSAYSRYFNYSGTITPNVCNVLSKQLLLLRIFFEVNKDSKEDVYSIRKYEIFDRYIEMIKNRGVENIREILDAIIVLMQNNDNYDEIKTEELKNTGISSGIISKILDSSILIGKKLILHEGTIARNEIEVVYFVFDEMRDYCLARKILLDNISEDNINEDAILKNIVNLKEKGMSCAEGVINYIYIFFRTDKVINRLNKTNELCNKILDIYRISDVRDSYIYRYRQNRGEIQNLGMRIILTSGLTLAGFEIAYIQDCLRKDPHEDGGAFFDTMLDGTLYGDENNIDKYLDILFGLKNKSTIGKVLGEITTNNIIDNSFPPEDFIENHKKLIDEDQTRALQIHKVAELFLMFYTFKDKELQGNLTNYFYQLPMHREVYDEMKSKLMQF